MISFDVTHAEHDLIIEIAKRADAIAEQRKVERLDRVTLLMDLCATHANGCPLRLRELLDAETFDFTHDVWGISNHIDRETDKLTRHFVPRYAA